MLKLNWSKCIHVLQLGILPIAILVATIMINKERIAKVVKFTNDVGKIQRVMERIFIC